jgi:hypothetical protein
MEDGREGIDEEKELKNYYRGIFLKTKLPSEKIDTG